MRRAAAIALVLAAMPATALAQGVSCRDCEHIVPYFRGEGGFIGTLAEDAETVMFVASCGNVTITGQVEARGGTVAQLFAHRNGLACDVEGGSLEIAGLEDGGWYWVTDDLNSAVGSLVSKDVLDNETTEITRAGPGVTMTEGQGAVYLKEAATGRVGILPNILPRPPEPPVEACGPRRSTVWPYPYSEQKLTTCALGDGRTEIRLLGPGANDSRQRITTGTVARPASGSLTVTADLWVNETGSFSTDASGANGAPGAESVRKGWLGKTAAGQSDHNANWLTATFSATVTSAGSTPPALAEVGVALTNNGSGSDPAGQATFTISASESHCPETGSQHTASLDIAATPGENAIQPAIATGKDAGLGEAPEVQNYAAVTRLKIVCPPR